MLEKDQPIKTPFPQRVIEFKQRRLPLLVWLVAAIACGWMLTGRGARFEYVGLAQSLDYEISATTTGKLESVIVQLYDDVDSGDVVARLDDTEVAARLERSHATIRQLTAELQATRVLLLSTNDQDRAAWTSDLRRFQTDEEDRRLATLELRVTIEGDEIELERLALMLDRSAPLVTTGLIGGSEYDEMRLRHDEVRTRNEENQFLLAQTEQEYSTAQSRRREFERSLPSLPTEEPLLEPLRQAIAVESERLAEIRARRKALVLRSPVTGRVSQILCRNGQTVVPGEPILTVTDRSVKQIITYLHESDDRQVRENTQVIVSSLSRPGKAAESLVVRLGPGLEKLPQRLWRSPTIPDYGRAVVIAGIPRLELTPGELINVKFLDDRGAP